MFGREGGMEKDELRLKAERCLAHATTASDESSKISFLAMAQAWLRLALHKEQRRTARDLASDAASSGFNDEEPPIS